MDLKQLLRQIEDLRQSLDYEKALSLIEDLPPDASNENLQVLIVKASILNDIGRFRDAIPIWENIVDRFDLPSNSGIYARLAQAYRKTDNNQLSIDLFNQITPYGAPSPFLFAECAESLYELEQADNAIKLYEQANKIYVDNLFLLRSEIVLLVRTSKYDLALDRLYNFMHSSIANADQVGRYLLAWLENRRENALISQTDNKQRLRAYWSDRKDFVYLHVCKQIIRIFARSARVVADIGSNNTPILDYFGEKPMKYSVDVSSPYENDDVITIRQDFLKWHPNEHIHFGTCLEVLEHVENPIIFCRRLMDVCEVILVSVPYQEIQGVNPSHLHSKIDYETVTKWFEREPNYYYIASELSGDQRIICIYDTLTSVKFKSCSKNSAIAFKFKYRWTLDSDLPFPSGRILF